MKKNRVLIISVLLFTLVIIVPAILFFYLNMGKCCSHDSTDWANFGSYFGGFVGGSFSILTFILLLLNYLSDQNDRYLQSKESKLRDDLNHVGLLIETKNRILREITRNYGQAAIEGEINKIRSLSLANTYNVFDEHYLNLHLETNSSITEEIDVYGVSQNPEQVNNFFIILRANEDLSQICIQYTQYLVAIQALSNYINLSEISSVVIKASFTNIELKFISLLYGYWRTSHHIQDLSENLKNLYSENQTEQIADLQMDLYKYKVMDFFNHNENNISRS